MLFCGSFVAAPEMAAASYVVGGHNRCCDLRWGWLAPAIIHRVMFHRRDLCSFL